MNQDSSSDKLIELSIFAALEAGKAIMAFYHEAVQVDLKADNSPVTAADHAAHKAIIKHLSQTGIPIISEEGESVTYEERKAWRKFWLVDPLDGTKEFIHRNGEFTVNIALIENDLPVIGVVYAPVTGDLFIGKVGADAWYIDHADSLQMGNINYSKCPIRPLNSSVSGYTLAVSRSHQNQETLEYIEDKKAKLGNIATLAAGSSMKFCLVAQGKANEYPRFGPTMEWDTAAGHAILKAVGKDIFTFPDGEPLKYNKPTLVNDPFLAH
jgi:3'(2'), 5'-bisphosphate nucleotidase